MEQESDTSFSLKNDAETNTIPPMNMQSGVLDCTPFVLYELSITFLLYIIKVTCFLLPTPTSVLQ